LNIKRSVNSAELYLQHKKSLQIIVAMLAPDVDTYCLSIKNATEDMPFKDEYLIFKVFGKWFAVIPLNDYELNISVK